MDTNEYLLQEMVVERLREARSRAAVRAMLASRDRTRRIEARPNVHSQAATGGRWTTRLGRWWRAATYGGRRSGASLHGTILSRSARKRSAAE
jgi:hypothetical protein